MMNDPDHSAWNLNIFLQKQGHPESGGRGGYSL